MGDDAASDSRASVTADEIVDAALSVIDSDGFAALSMRRLAGDLGVFPATLYWHVGNREQLLGLVCERVLGEVSLPPAGLQWRDWVFTFARQVREVVGAHPRFAAYFVTNIQVSTASLTIADHLWAVLNDAGFSGNDLLRAYNAILGAVFGWVSGEFAAGSDERADSDRARIEREVEDAAETGRFPAVQAAWPMAANRAFMLRWDSGTTSPLISSYELMVTALIDGLERYRR